MAKIVVIVPSSGLKERFLEASDTIKSEIHVEVGQVANALAIVQEKEKEGIDVLISYGAIAHHLAQHCHLPLVTIQTSGYDILRTLLLLQGFPGKIGVIGTPMMVEGAETISTLLNIPLTLFSIKAGEESTCMLQKAAESGVQALISDTVEQAAAVSYGLNTLTLIPGKEAVVASLYEAERLAHYVSSIAQVDPIIKIAVEEHSEATIISDTKGNVVLLNKKARHMINLETCSFLDWLLQFEKGPSGVIQGTTTIANQTIEVQSKPLFQNEQHIGSITVLKKVQTAREGKQQLTEIPAQEQAHFTRLIAGTQNMQAQIETARLFSNHEAPVCLYGEQGVGKQSFAEAIHNESSRQKQPFLVLDCDILKQNQTDYGLFTVDSDTNLFAAAHGGTVYIKNIGHLPVGLQDKLTRLLQIKKIEQSEQPHVAKLHPRILTSHPRNLKLEVEAGIFREDLYHLLNGGSLRVPPLRKRKEDIPELIRWFIVSYNMREGKQIVGLRPELMNRLTAEEWPGNVEQLQNAVEKICQAGNGPFIALEAVRDILEDVFALPPAPKPPVAAIDPMETKKGTGGSKRETSQHTGQEIHIAGKTLEELETEIILRVLEEENNNQSQTAKRLGINRTTLWRKVKEATEQT